MIDNNTHLNNVSEKAHWLYDSRAILVASDLLERRVKLVDIINEFFITMED